MSQETTQTNTDDRVNGDGGSNLLRGSAATNCMYGMGGQDSIYGYTGDDSIFGGSAVADRDDGGDSIDGGTGSDIIYANGGDDTVTASLDAGNDTVYGGFGADNVNYESSANQVLLYGNENSDTLLGGAGDDTFYGGAGIVDLEDAGDSMNGGTGDDIIYANAGNDTVTGSAGEDRVFAGRGNDFLDYRLDLGAVLLYGNEDSDTVYGGTGDDTLYGGSTAYDVADSADTIDGGNGADVIYANAGADSISGSAGKDTVYGGADNDIIDYGTDSANVRLYGNENGDTILAGSGNDTIYGGSNEQDNSDGADSIIAGTGADKVYAGGGDDTVAGVGTASAASTVYGGIGNDSIDWSAVVSYGAIIYGEDGADSIIGAASANTLDGGSGADTLIGGNGSDRISGGNGADIITLGDGVQNIIYYTENHAAGTTNEDLAAGSASMDTIQSFAVNTGSAGDSIRFSGALFIDSLIAGGGRAGEGGSIAAMVDSATFTNGVTGAIEYYEDGSDLYLCINTSNTNNYSYDADITVKLEGITSSGIYGPLTVSLSARGDITIASYAYAQLGTEGVDTLTGTANADYIVGLGSNDIFTFSIANLTADDTLYGGSSASDTATGDAIKLTNAGTLAESIWLHKSGIEKITLASSSSANTIILSSSLITAVNGSAFMVDGLAASGNDSIDGSLYTGNVVGMSITGGNGNDTIVGGSGNDTITGGDNSIMTGAWGGSDLMIGGAGDDVFKTSGSNFTQEDTITGGEGTDSIMLSAGFSLADTNFSHVTGIEAISMLAGGRMGVGANLFAAIGIGNTLTINNATFTLQFSLSSYTDSFFIKIAGTGAINLQGTAGHIYAADGVNTKITVSSIFTLNDTIIGGTGNDSLTGSNGSESLVGGAGDDSLYGSNADTVAGSAGNDTLVGGSGADMITLSTKSDSSSVIRYEAADMGTSGYDTIYNFTGGNGTGYDRIDWASELVTADGTTVSGGEFGSHDLTVANYQASAGVNINDSSATIVLYNIALGFSTIEEAGDYLLASLIVHAGQKALLLVGEGATGEENTLVYYLHDDNNSGSLSSAELSIVAVLMGVSPSDTMDSANFV